MDRLEKKKMADEKCVEILNLKVPTKDELNQLLYNLHANQFHCNYSVVQRIFKQKGIRYYGINSLIDVNVGNCPLCVKTFRTIYIWDSVKSININWPNYRYEFDITYLNHDLKGVYAL